MPQAVSRYVQLLMAGDLDMGHARALLTLDRATQITAANQIAAKKMSVRETESLVKKYYGIEGDGAAITVNLETTDGQWNVLASVSGLVGGGSSKYRNLHLNLDMADFTQTSIEILGSESVYGANAAKAASRAREVVLKLGAMHPEEKAPVAEGEIFVTRPDGRGRTAVVGRIKIDEWPALAGGR